jgi:hypothetical protein
MRAQRTNDANSYRRDLEEFDRMIGPRPLPPHFGEIDVTAPFDPHRYFTMLRCTGGHPYLWRHEEQGVMYCQGAHRPGFLHGPSELHKRRFYESVAWATAQDKDHKKTNLFLSEIAKSKPAGNFMHYLGC